MTTDYILDMANVRDDSIFSAVLLMVGTVGDLIVKLHEVLLKQHMGGPPLI